MTPARPSARAFARYLPFCLLVCGVGRSPLVRALVFPPGVVLWGRAPSSRATAAPLRRAATAGEQIPSAPTETSPLSRRILLEKAGEIDPALARGEAKGSYSAVGWSNRVGTVLLPVSIPGVYEASRPFIWNNIDVGGRMTIVQLSSASSDDGKPDLFVHSPVALDAPLVSALDKLGTVKHVVSPNYEHVKYASQWADQFPDAYIWGCPGLAEREPDVRWTGEVPYGARPEGYPCVRGEGDPPSKPTGKGREAMWDWTEVQPLHVDTEVNPFTGKAFFNEVVFFHVLSKTLICTDTYWNYPSPDGVTNVDYSDVAGKEEDFGVWELAPEVGKIPLGSQLWKIGMDKLFRPFYNNLMVKSDARERFVNIVRYISGEGWDVQTIVPCHGDVVRGKELCRNILREHFGLEK